jgi:hypothetical protein
VAPCFWRYHPSVAVCRSAVDVFATSLGGSSCVAANIVKDADSNANPA